MSEVSPDGEHAVVGEMLVPAQGFSSEVKNGESEALLWGNGVISEVVFGLEDPIKGI